MRQRETMVESAFLVVAVIAGGMLLCGAARVDAAGCTNNVCQLISFYCQCVNGGLVGTCYQLNDLDCQYCTSNNNDGANPNGGRCDGSSTAQCKKSDIKVQYRTVNEVTWCTCQKAPNKNSSTVENQNAAATGIWKTSTTEVVHTCPPS
jgi:hypothetical protein